MTTEEKFVEDPVAVVETVAMLMDLIMFMLEKRN